MHAEQESKKVSRKPTFNPTALVDAVTSHVQCFTVPARASMIEVFAAYEPSNTATSYTARVSYYADTAPPNAAVTHTIEFVFEASSLEGDWDVEFKFNRPSLGNKIDVKCAEDLPSVFDVTHDMLTRVTRLHVAVSEASGLLALLNSKFRT